MTSLTAEAPPAEHDDPELTRGCDDTGRPETTIVEACVTPGGVFDPF